MQHEIGLSVTQNLYIIKKYFPNEAYEIGDENIEFILAGNDIEIVRAKNAQYSDVASSLDTIEKVISIIANIIAISAAIKAVDAKNKAEKLLEEHKKQLTGLPIQYNKLYAFIVDVIERRQNEN